MSHVHDQMDTLESKVSNLQNTVDETTGTVQLVSSFLLGGVPSCVFFAVLLVLGLWSVNKRAAGVVMAGCGKCIP
jgi:hypothetical protein